MIIKWIEGLIITIMLFIFSFLSIYSQNSVPEYLQKYPTVEYMMQNSNMGKRFYIAIPQNDIKSGQQEEILAIYVCSYKDTKVKLSYPRYGIDKQRDVKAFKPTILSSKNNDASFNWEITESEVIAGDAIIITSDDPIAVYVLSSRDGSSDGYLAIPSSAWGKKYVHSAYYDHKESWPSNIRRGGGFIVISAHDGTGVSIKLNGAGGDVGQTVGKRKIGETISITLKEGQTYMVRGDASTDKGFDLTGTIIESTKPVGVISYHQRTMIPNESPNGRDHLSEMLLPVESWGKEFITMEFNRGGQGDFFRAVAYEDGTRIVGDQYFPGSGNPIPDGHIETFLNKGQFWEHLQASCGDNNKQNGVRGVTVWKSNKPIQLMQLAYSFPWDNEKDWDPLMIMVPPIGQFQQSAVIMPPVDAGFQTNELTFFALGNPNDPQREILNTIQLNGEVLSKNYQQFLYNRIPGTNYFWGRVSIEQKVNSLTSNTKLSGYMTGFSGYNSYGWPAMTGTNKIDELDTLAPEILLSDLGCGVFKGTCYEQRNAFTGTNPQKDQGIRGIYLVDEASKNYQLITTKKDKFFPELLVTQQEFELRVVDPTQNAKAYILVGDRAGNYSVDSVVYVAPVMSYNTSGMNFNSCRMYKTHSNSFIIRNLGNQPLIVDSAKMVKSIRFQMRQAIGTYPLPWEILPGDSMSLFVSYTPISEAKDIDTLYFKLDCIKLAVPVYGSGVYPKITTEDWTSTKTEVGSTICFEQQRGNGIRIGNEGSDTLHIVDFIVPQSPFTVSQPTYPIIPFVLAPGEVKYFESVCFSPTDTGTFKSELIFLSDDKFGDSVVSLNATAFIKVGVNDNVGVANFSISPNPVNSESITINYSTNYSNQLSLKLYDLEGRLVKELMNQFIESGSYSTEFNLDEIQNGVYYIEYNLGITHEIQKLIICR